MTSRSKRQTAAAAVMHAQREASALGILYSEAVARQLGISSGDLECLDFVANNQPVTAGALALETGLSTGAITGLIDRLVDAGFARRLASEEDRRKVFISTTDAFHRKVVPLFEPMQRLQASIIASYTEEHLRLVAEFMTASLGAARDAIAEITSKRRKK